MDEETKQKILLAARVLSFHSITLTDYDVSVITRKNDPSFEVEFSKEVPQGFITIRPKIKVFIIRTPHDPASMEDVLNYDENYRIEMKCGLEK